MSKVNGALRTPAELLLGTEIRPNVPPADQRRQRAEVDEILRRLQNQPGVILADEVGMGKTFVALGVAYSVAATSRRGPVIVMAPANLIEKWEQDLRTFCELYVPARKPVKTDSATTKELTAAGALRFGVARHSIDLLRLLDDAPRTRCHLIFLTQGAMSRAQTDKWVRLALIAEALRRHGRGKAKRLIQVKQQIHRFLAELLWAIGEQRASDWGEELWQKLLKSDPSTWKETYNADVRNAKRELKDDPVPKSVVRALNRVTIDLKPLAEALERMPVRARGDDARLSERLADVRTSLREVEAELWTKLLAESRWRSPLLVMDEAHHLKNSSTKLARQLQSELNADLRTGDGAMARAFDRMLFLTATPFQLGHHELVQVLRRFRDVRWEEALGTQDAFDQKLNALEECLNQSQHAAILLRRKWSDLTPEDCDGDENEWWTHLTSAELENLNHRQRSVREAYEKAQLCREAAQEALQPWIVRHNKGAVWSEAPVPIQRRRRRVGLQLINGEGSGGIPIPADKMLPFFLAARSAIDPRHDLLAEALSSSFEAFRHTRSRRAAMKDEQDESDVGESDLTHARWYLQEFDRALEQLSGAVHPKVDSTVRHVVDLWETGEKVLVFAFYRRTCSALRNHISREIDRRMTDIACRRFAEVGKALRPEDVSETISGIQARYFDRRDSAGGRALNAALQGIIDEQADALIANGVSDVDLTRLSDIMRRFLRVATTIVRCFPIATADGMEPEEAVRIMLDHADGSGITWRTKFSRFLHVLGHRFSETERQAYLKAAASVETGDIRVSDEEESRESDGSNTAVANVRMATGATRRQTRATLMRAFNTPFFPDILVCSQVMGEGVDLQRYCRHVIHHDLDWNPSTIEQRTGRIDRLGCKAENLHSIDVALAYLAGAADERQYHVMSDREHWFRVVMGQDQVAKLIAPDSDHCLPMPAEMAESLNFQLNVV